jgi:Trm5-related predicted tRNA methylase
MTTNTDPTASPEPASEPTADELAYIAANDLNGDGKINAAEQFIAKVGEFDDKLEQRAERGGVVGAVAGLLHKVVDTLDNDEPAPDQPAGS